jgi:hypothetical protein
MTIPDLINGGYEFIGGIAVWYNVLAIIKDKGYAGVRISTMGFFTSWSLWNLYYYPHLHQWASFFGGLSIGIANLLFIIAMLHYGRKK